jgi:DNA-directed RNA polymerase subunit K/omega
MRGKHDDSQEEQLPVDNLSRRLGRYNLVVAVSKRSRDLKERIDSVLVPSSAALIGRSLQEIAAGKVKILAPANEEEETSEETEE